MFSTKSPLEHIWWLCFPQYLLSSPPSLWLCGFVFSNISPYSHPHYDYEGGSEVRVDLMFSPISPQIPTCIMRDYEGGGWGRVWLMSSPISSPTPTIIIGVRVGGDIGEDINPTLTPPPLLWGGRRY
jgi:hypothetical protein